MQQETSTYMDNFDEADEKWNNLDAMGLIEKTLYVQYNEEVLPEIQLILGIMKSAGDENDLEYFASPSFTYHCTVLGLDDEAILESIVRKSLLTPAMKSRHNYQTIVDEYDEIIRLYVEEGLSQKDLATMYNISAPTMRKVLKGTFTPRIAFNGKQNDIINDYLYGISVTELASLYNLKRTNIYKAIEGVPKRSRRKTNS